MNIFERALRGLLSTIERRRRFDEYVEGTMHARKELGEILGLESRESLREAARRVVNERDELRRRVEWLNQRYGGGEA